jgi:hypothetical protein
MVLRCKSGKAAVYLFLAVSIIGKATQAQSFDPNALIRSAAANYKDSVLQADKYEYVENDATLFSGALVDTKVSDTYEIMVINGHPYRRHIGHDGLALPQRKKSRNAKISLPRSAGTPTTRWQMPRWKALCLMGTSSQNYR